MVQIVSIIAAWNKHLLYIGRLDNEISVLYLSALDSVLCIPNIFPHLPTGIMRLECPLHFFFGTAFHHNKPFKHKVNKNSWKIKSLNHGLRKNTKNATSKRNLLCLRWGPRRLETKSWFCWNGPVDHSAIWYFLFSCMQQPSTTHKIGGIVVKTRKQTLVVTNPKTSWNTILSIPLIAGLKPTSFHQKRHLDWGLVRSGLRPEAMKITGFPMVMRLLEGFSSFKSPKKPSNLK